MSSSIVARSTFMAGTLARTSFRSLVSAAADAGHDSITLWPNTWRHALRKDSLTLPTMRRMLEDHDISVVAVEGCVDWAPAATPQEATASRRKSDIPRTEFFEVCEALDCPAVGAAHPGRTATDIERDTAGFAALCDDAAKHGLRIALEPVGISSVPNLAVARRIIEGSGRGNADYLVDILHAIRGGGGIDDLRTLPADRISMVQLCDGPGAAPADLLEEIVYGRRLPGDGQFDVAAWLGVMGEMGVRASVGVEVYRRSFEYRQPVDVMRECLAATRQMLREAGMELPA